MFDHTYGAWVIARSGDQKGRFSHSQESRARTVT